MYKEPPDLPAVLEHVQVLAIQLWKVLKHIFHEITVTTDEFTIDEGVAIIKQVVVRCDVEHVAFINVLILFDAIFN